MKKILIVFFLSVIILSALTIAGLYSFLTIAPPEHPQVDTQAYKVLQKSDSLWVCGNSWLHHSRTGLYEMYTEGEAYRRGLVTGKLSKALIYKQEKAFVDQIHKMVPSESYLRLLRLMLAFFNRNIDHYIKPEYLHEISGISESASGEFNDIGSKYQRMMNYHAAHDIGHMLQNYNLVGCTSFAAWGDKSADSGLVIGRNFDFYVGDEFAEDKIVSFVKPDSGYNFMYITWGGMSGVVSGMNTRGLTVTINASKSYFPVQVATPISLVARHILQYAQNISEAQNIAAGYTTFVSESLLIGSAKDKKACIIEKSPFMSDMVWADSAYLVCTNHYQGEAFINDAQNLTQQKTTPTAYRFERTKQLLHQHFPLSEKAALSILRDPYGINGEKIGFTNEMAVNQYLAHHSIIFKPEKLQVWVSTKPFQLGEFVCYDLNQVFSGAVSPVKSDEIFENDLSLQADWKMAGEYYRFVPVFKQIRENLLNYIYHNNKGFDETLLNKFIQSNPDYFQVYSLSGEYYLLHKDYNKALFWFKLALEKPIPFASEKHHIEMQINQCYLELKTKHKK